MADTFDPMTARLEDAPSTAKKDEFDPSTATLEKPRTWGEAAKDTGAAVMGGLAGLVKTGGDLYGLASGNMDNAASELGRNAQEYWSDAKSQALQTKIAQRKANIDAQESTLGKAWTAVKDTLTDPALAADTVAENVATMLPGAGVGRAVGAAKYARGFQAASEFGPASLAAREAIAKQAGKYATGAAIGTGAVQQGADVSGDIYGDLMKKTDAEWDASPDFQSALQRHGGDRQAAKSELANATARAAFLPAAGISVAANAIPGATYLERALVGAPLRTGAKEVGRFGAARGFARGVLGEGGQEFVEEGGGRLGANLAAQQQAMPGHDTWDGVGENAGMGFAGGALLGVGGGVHGAREAMAQKRAQDAAKGAEDGGTLETPAADTPPADVPPGDGQAGPGGGLGAPTGTGADMAGMLAPANPLLEAMNQRAADPSAIAPPIDEGKIFDKSAAAPVAGELYQPGDTTNPLTGERITAKPSEAMGINPADGPLSTGAALAVDTGVSEQMQQAAALAEAVKAAPKTPVGEAKAAAPDLSGWSDQQLSDTFRSAQAPDVRRQLANELQRRRDVREQQSLRQEMDAERAALDMPDAPDDIFASVREDAGEPEKARFENTPSTEARKESPVSQQPKEASSGPQALETQQAVAQPAQAGSPQAGAATATASTVPAGGNRVQAVGLTDGTTIENPGAQAAPAASTQAQAPGSEVEALRQQLRDVEDRIIAAAPSAMGQGGGDIEAAMKSRKVPVTLKAQRKKLKEQLQQSQDLQQNQPPAQSQQAQAATEQQSAPGRQSTETAYTLPSGSIGDEWRDGQKRSPEHPDFTPTPRQQRLMNAVKKALDGGAIYNDDVTDKVAKALGVSGEVLASNRTGVQGGDFGYDVYLARKAVEAQAQEAEAAKIRAELNLRAGDKLGTLIFNDFKQTNSVEVVSISEDGRRASFKGKRGAATVTFESLIPAVKFAIERAHEKGKRKDSYEEFIAGRSASPQEGIAAAQDKAQQAQAATEQQAASATHKDPVQAPEAATPAVVAESLQKAARNEDTKPSEMRKWLLAEIDKELLQAPDRANYDEAVKRLGEKDAISMFTGNGPLGKNSETGFITFDVPGDGKYKVRNSVRGLLEFRKNVMASQGFKDSGQKRTKPEQNDGVQGGSGSSMAAITNMIEEGDFEAARDYAEAVGIKLEDVKVPRGDMKPAWEKYLKDGTLPEQRRTSTEWSITNEQNPNGTWSKVGVLKRVADGAEYVATVRGDLDGTNAQYTLTKDGKETGKMTSRQPFSRALEMAEDAMPEANDKPAPSKANDTGWNMAGTGYGGKRYIGRNITLDDGREVVARVYENAGTYEEAEVKVDGVRKFTVTDRDNAQGKADAFIRTLQDGDQAAGSAKSPTLVTPQISGNPERFIKVAADSVSELRKSDVDRVLTETPVQFRAEVASYIRDQRKDLADEVDDVMAGIQPQAAAPAPSIPAGYKPAGEPFYRNGKQIQGYAPFAPGERVTMKESAGQSGVVESLTSPDDAGVFSGAMVKFDNGSTQIVKFDKLDAEAKAAPATGTRRDPTKVSMFNPYNDGDIVTIDGQDWTVKADTPGWYLTTTGNWRGQHPTIRNVKAMADLIREVEQAAEAKPATAGRTYQSAYDAEVERMHELADKKGVPASGINDDLSASLASLTIGRGFNQSPDEFLSANPAQKGRRDAMVAWRNGQIDHKPGQSEWAKRREKAQPAAESDTPKLTPAEAKSLMEWQDMGQKDGVKTHALTFYESQADKDAKRGRMIVAKVTKGDRSANNWMVEGDDKPLAVLGMAKKRAEEIGMAKAVADGFVEPAATKPAAAPQPAAPAAPIDDFGEKLEGARKDMPPSLKEEVSDEKIASLPLSKIWPSDAHESIEDDAAAALVFAARQEIPAKPRVPSRVRAWVSKVKTYRTLVKDLGKNSLERIEQLSKEKGFHSLDPFFAKVRLLSQLPRDTWSRVERVEEYPNAIRYEKDGSKTAVAFSSVTIDGKSRRFDGVGKIGPDEVQAVKEMLGTAAPKKDGLTAQDFEVRGTAKTGYKINRKGDSEYRPLKIFTGEDAAKKALAWRDEHTAELEAAWEAVKARDNVSKAEIRRDENRERTGENRRNGRDVTAQMFTDAFGFRGAQFGNWVGQGADAKSRQGMLNDAYDALLDLSDILGIQSRAISLNGTLGLSFGARGSGKAAAHFEPSNLVINLTKTRGAGSLAHEWFHALDNYFSRMRGGEVAFTGDNNAYRQNNYVTYKPEAAWGKAPITPYTNFMRGGQLRERLQRLPGFTYDANKTLAENAKAAGFERDPSHKDGVRPQVEKAFADLVQALNDSPMAKRASSLDKAADGYWGRIIERGARSFENYVISKMAQRGWSNDFLANIRSFDEWMAMGKNAERYPYLKPEEDAPVVAAFDKLFETVETKEDDTGNVAMFSRTPATQAAIGTPAATIRAAITKAYGKLLGQLESKGLVTLTQTQEQAIEAAAQARAAKTGQSVERERARLQSSIRGEADELSMSIYSDEAGKIERALEAMGLQVSTEGSRISQSTYVIVESPEYTQTEGESGSVLKIRVSDHRLPGGYQQPDFEVQVGNAHQGVDMADAAGAWFDAVRWVGGRFGVEPKGAAKRQIAAAAEKEAKAKQAAVAAADQQRDRLDTSKARLQAWLQSLPDGALWGNARRGGWVAVLDGKMIGRFDGETATGEGQPWYGGPYPVEAQKNLQPVRESLRASVKNSVADPDIRRSADGSIQGFFDPQTGQSFLVADNLTAEAAPGVLMHEVGIHMAADGSMKALFNRAATMLKLQRGNPFMKAVQARMDAAGETSGEEAAAYIAEAYENDRANAPASVQRWLADLLAAVKAWMFKKGIMGADRLTVADIAAVARANAKSATQTTGTPTDRAIMDMAREGKSAQDILRLIAGTSRSRFNRQVARLLLRTGVTPKVEALASDGLGKDKRGFNLLAKYSRDSNTISLTEGAGYMAEQIMLHELIHAATLRALDRKGLASLQMRRLFEHVQKHGGLAGTYGMKNVGEFTSEAFTNPEFQRALRQIAAPPGGRIKAAWDGFVRILRSILGLPQSEHSALSQALELGVAVMREDMALRQRGVVARGRDAQAGIDQTQTEAFKRWFKNSKVVDAEGRPLVVYHGTPKVGFTTFDTSNVGAFFSDRFDIAASYAGRYNDVEFDEHGAYADDMQGVYASYLSLENPMVVDWAGKDWGDGPEGLKLDEWASRAKRAGHDGLIVENVVDSGWLAPGIVEGKADGRVFVAFRPEQIKSAIGNNGNFDPEDTDIAHFGAAELRGLKDNALDRINTVMSHPGTVSLWDKTVGTMRHLAQRAPAFKPVFEAAQRFIDDVAMMANDAADMAPRVLPRVDTWRDLAKKPISAADNKAIAKPLFEGTLMWGRDVDGKPALVSDMEGKYASLSADDKAQMMLKAGRIDPGVLKMWQGLPAAQYEAAVNSRFSNTLLKGGVVWTDKELADIFKATPEQAALYREARATIDRSIDMTARADMLRLLGEEYAPMRDLVLEAPSLQEALTLLVETLEQDAQADFDSRERLADLMHGLRQRHDKAQELMDQGYAPLSRFGRYTVDVVDQNGERQYFGMFESMREANLMKLRMASAFPGATVTQGTMSQEAYKLFAGITPESLELFGNMLGLGADGADAQDKAFQEYLKLAKNNHSALKRLIHRQGIAGYSEDVGRVLASFVYSNARQAAGGLNAGTMESAINAIPKQEGELKDVAMGLQNYIRDPQEEGQAVRGMLFAQYLGGSVASAFVNMTQPFAVTMPWLSQYGGIKSAGAHLAKALKDMGTKGFKYEADLAAALKHAEDDGVVSPQEIHQLMAQARGSGSLRSGDGTKVGEARAAAANAWERTKVAWGQPFALAEQFNRRSTFIAAYRIAKEQKMADPAAFARRAVEETQFVYSKAAKSRWMRGAIGGTLMTFKSYSIQYLELLHRMWTQGGPEGKRAVGWAMVMLMLAGGAGGLPFMEDLEDLIDGIAQLMGYNVSSKQWRQRALRDVLGKEFAEFMEQGVSGLPGAPVDVSGRLGLGNLIPGTGLLLQKPNRERDLLEVAGPAGDLFKRGFTGGRKLLAGDVGGAALEVSPTAVRNAVKGADMAASGMYKDAKGYKVIDTTLGEALAKAGGFQPRSVAQVQEANSFMMRSRSFYQQNSAEIKAQWADALFRKDDAALERVRERLAAWNRDNPEQPIVVKMPDVWKRVREMGKDRTQRIADTAPKALRQQMREMALENG